MKIKDRYWRRFARGLLIPVVSNILAVPFWIITVALGVVYETTSEIFFAVMLAIWIAIAVPVVFYIYGWVAEKTVEDWITEY